MADVVTLKDAVEQRGPYAVWELMTEEEQRAAAEELQGILGFETRPLVSIDYRSDPRSSVVDALSTLVINGTQVKLYLWYDNEWGYANRSAELLQLLATAER